MALRVLLADESSTIKKVFQLALQDYAVDVKSVNVGTDVLSIAQNFKPDIVFADVLLQKQNGYDVSGQIKTSPELQNTPVVLMWSGFMDLDESKFNESSADGKLEKPFDVQTLRGLVNQYVPKTQSQILSKYLSFPDMPEIEEKEPNASPDNTTWSANSFDNPEQPPQLIQEQETDGDEFSFGTDSELEAADDFQEISISPQQQKIEKPEDDNAWVQQDLSEFQIGDELDLDEKPPVEYQVPTANDPIEPQPAPIPEVALPDVELDLDLGSFSVDEQLKEAEPIASTSPSTPQIDPAKLEEIIAKQTREIIEKVVWQVVPEIAKQVIEKELQKLLEDQSNGPE